MAFAVSPALVQRDGDVVRHMLQHVVHPGGVCSKQVVRLGTPSFDRGAMNGVAQERDGRSCADQRVNLLAVCGNDIGPEALEVAVMSLQHALISATVHVDEDGGGERYLGYEIGVGFQEFESADRGARPPADRTVHPQARERLGRAILLAPHHLGRARSVGGKALPAHDQIKPPTSPPKFTVGCRLQAATFTT
jgi:hypothetical protein